MVLTHRLDLDASDPVALGFGLELATSLEGGELFRLGPRSGEEYVYGLRGFADSQLQVVESANDVSASDGLSFTRRDFRGGAGLSRSGEDKEERATRYLGGTNLYVDFDTGRVRPIARPYTLTTGPSTYYLPGALVGFGGFPRFAHGGVCGGTGMMSLYASGAQVWFRNFRLDTNTQVGGAIVQAYDVAYDSDVFGTGASGPSAWAGGINGMYVYDDSTAAWTQRLPTTDFYRVWFIRGRLWTIQPNVGATNWELCVYNDLTTLADATPIVTEVGRMANYQGPIDLVDVGSGLILTMAKEAFYVTQQPDLTFELTSTISFPHGQLTYVLPWGDKLFMQVFTDDGRVQTWEGVLSEGGDLSNLKLLHTTPPAALGDTAAQPMGAVSLSDGLYFGYYNGSHSPGFFHMEIIRIDPSNGAWHPYLNTQESTASSARMVPVEVLSEYGTETRPLIFVRRMTVSNVDVTIPDIGPDTEEATLLLPLVDMNTFSPKVFGDVEIEIGNFVTGGTVANTTVRVEWRTADYQPSKSAPPWDVLINLAGSTPERVVVPASAIGARAVEARDLELRVAFGFGMVGELWVDRIRVGADVVMEERVWDVPVLISDRVERLGRAPVDIPGLGKATRNRLRELEGQRLLVTLLGLDEPTFVGIIELAASATDEWFFRDGTPFQVQMIRITGGKAGSTPASLAQALRA